MGKQTAQTILVVDDEKNLRHTLALILKRAGYFVTTAGSANEALQNLQSGPFDLMFLDLKMPDVDGLTLLPELRENYPGMPVVILTAHATLESAIEAIRYGARDYLLKPFDPSQIISRVEDILHENEQPRRRREIVHKIQDLLSELNVIETEEQEGKTTQPASAAVDPSRFIQRGPFVLDLHARYVTCRNKTISLSPTAFDYLVTLIRHSPNPVSYETLVMEAQGYKASILEARDMARWRIHELRKALEQDPRQPEYIITVRSIGYRLLV
jgi:DNA-binding response OmpR family regulator